MAYFIYVRVWILPNADDSEDYSSTIFIRRRDAIAKLIIDQFGDSETRATHEDASYVDFVTQRVGLGLEMNDYLRSTTSHYRILVQGAKDVQSVVHARYVPFLSAADYCDSDSRWNELNTYDSACNECGWALSPPIPDPYVVMPWIRSKKQEVFAALNGLIIVTARVRDLLQHVIKDQIIDGRVRCRDRTAREPGYYWLRPRFTIGTDVRFYDDSHCGLCGARTSYSYHEKINTLMVTLYGERAYDIARIPTWNAWRGNRASPGIMDIAVSGGLFAYLYNNGVNGLVYPDDGPYLSARAEEAPLTPERRFADLTPGKTDKIMKKRVKPGF